MKPSRLLCAAAILLGIGGVLVPGTGPAGAVAPTCGGLELTKASGVPWLCTFDDEFSGTSLDRTKWFVQTTAAGGFQLGDTCMVDTPQTVSVSGGNLNLSVRKAAAPFMCKRNRSSVRLSWYGSSIYTRSFAQAYGRFSVRAKFPQANGISGLQSSVWTYPRVMQTGGTTEIDIAEAYSRWPDLIGATVHKFLAGTTKTCDLPDYAAKFHTYTVEWTPASAVFYYDNKECLSVPRTTTKNPFMVILSQGLGIRNDAYSGATPTVGTMQVAWVRVWK
jgi:beta-glucanase (GH16 family)